jgi:hypothetical protein
MRLKLAILGWCFFTESAGVELATSSVCTCARFGDHFAWWFWVSVVLLFLFVCADG